MFPVPTNIERRTNRICGGLVIFSAALILAGLAFDNNTITALGGIFAIAAILITR